MQPLKSSEMRTVQGTPSLYKALQGAHLGAIPEPGSCAAAHLQQHSSAAHTGNPPAGAGVSSAAAFGGGELARTGGRTAALAVNIRCLASFSAWKVLSHTSRVWRRE